MNSNLSFKLSIVYTLMDICSIVLHFIGYLKVEYLATFLYWHHVNQYWGSKKFLNVKGKDLEIKSDLQHHEND